MDYYLGIDIGSTSLTSVIIDLNKKVVIGSKSVDNSSEIISENNKKLGRSEWNLNKMANLAFKNTADLISETKISPSAIGVTGQQQGLQLLDDKYETVGNFISWQDQRSKDLLPNQNKTYLQLMGEIGGAKIIDDGLPTFENTGCPIVTGYTTPTLFWLKENNILNQGLYGTTAPEFIVSRLTDTKPITDPTDAVSWGVYDLNKNDWNQDLINSLGLNKSIFSELGESCSVVGTLSKNISELLGVKSGIPVSIASGDHQCSFAGTVSDYENTVAINIGTGGQSSLYIDKIIERGWLEIRPFIQSGYLIAGVGVVGGRTFRVLKDFFQNTINLLGHKEIETDLLYSKLVDLAGSVEKGSNSISFEPLFTGSRNKPKATGSIYGLTPANFTPAHITRSLFESIAEQLYISYNEAVKNGAGKRKILVGSGNGIKLNKIIQEEIETKFKMKINIGKNKEEAGIGAGLCAAVSNKAFVSIKEASKYFLN